MSAKSAAALVAALFLSPVIAAPPVDEQIGDLQRRLEIVTQIQQLQVELRELRGALEENNHDVSNLKRRQREFYLDLDRRLIGLESRSAAAAPDSSAQSASAAIKPVVQTAGDGSPAELSALEQQSYQQAFDLLKEAKYDEAISAFQKFLQLYPAGSYADNARYWIGEAYYVTRNFDKALIEFNRLLELHPSSGKRADTQLKIGYIYYEQKKWVQARELLTELMNQSTAGTAAHLAKTRLDRMTGEGH